MEDSLTAILSIVPTLLAAAVFYYLGVRTGQKQATKIVNQTTEKMAKIVVDAINADRRIENVNSGKVAIRKGGEAGADLIVSAAYDRSIIEDPVQSSDSVSALKIVAEKKKTVNLDVTLVKEGETSDPKIVAEKKVSHSTDSLLVGKKEFTDLPDAPLKKGEKK